VTRVCRDQDCDTILRSDNDTGYCSLHERPAAVEAIVCYLEGEELACVVAGLLLVHRGLRPGEPVILQSELRRLGIEATTEQIHNATRGLPRRGLALFTKEREAGYTLREWLTPGQAMMRAARQNDEDHKLLPSVAEADHKGGQSDGQK
jgi:hypothetical protein